MSKITVTVIVNYKEFEKNCTKKFDFLKNL